jgi:hypothetical protein
MLDPIILSTIIIVSATLLYKISILFYASKCNICKCNCKDGLVIERDTIHEQSIRHLDQSQLQVTST